MFEHTNSNLKNVAEASSVNIAFNFLIRKTIYYKKEEKMDAKIAATKKLYTSNMHQNYLSIHSRDVSSPSDSSIAFSPMLQQMTHERTEAFFFFSFFFHFPTKIAFPSQQMVSNRIRRNPKNTQAAQRKFPKSPNKLTVKQQEIH